MGLRLMERRKKERSLWRRMMRIRRMKRVLRMSSEQPNGTWKSGVERENFGTKYELRSLELTRKSVYNFFVNDML